MFSKALFFLFQVFSIIKLCHFYPSGAPLESCESMFPRHGVDPLSDKPPYNISIEPISDSKSFNGIIYKIFICVIKN